MQHYKLFTFTPLWGSKDLKQIMTTEIVELGVNWNWQKGKLHVSKRDETVGNIMTS